MTTRPPPRPRKPRTPSGSKPGPKPVPAGTPAQLFPQAARAEVWALETSRSHWQYGLWEKLAAIDTIALEDHPDRAKLALLAAAGHLQGGAPDAARRALRKALDWGADRSLTTRVLAAGLHSTLGRVAVLLEDDGAAAAHFRQSIALVEPQADVALLGRTRQLRETARLGLVEAATEALQGDLAEIALQMPEADTRLALLKGEIAVLQGEVQRALRRGQAATDPGPATPPPQAAADPVVPAGQLIVCNHHKSGTNVLRRIFDAVGKAFDMPIWLKFYDPEPRAGWRICFHQHSRVGELVADRTFRGLHCIRHPMGLIHSAALYHAMCREPWVDVPLERFTSATFRALSERDSYNRIKAPTATVEERRHLLAAATVEEVPTEGWPTARFDSGYAFAGRTYRQMLADRPDMADKLLFEMRCYSQGVIRDMLAFPKDARFATITLEAISHDPAMADLRRVFTHLGFGGSALDSCLEIASRHCLWNLPTLPAHATTGVSEAWREAFTGPVEAEYRRLFGWAEQALGYVD